MPAFRYEAIDAEGAIAKGVIDADSTRHGRDVLRTRGLLPVLVEPLVASTTEPQAADGKSHSSHLLSRRGGLNNFQLALMTRQFATLLNAGLTVEHALAALTEQGDSTREREALAAVRSDVMSGQSLTQALTDAGFPDVYCGLAGAGERSGQLATVMEKLAGYLERRQDTQARLMQALIYPTIVGLVAMAVVAALLIYVVPQLVSVFESARAALPWPTRALIATSGFLRATWWLWLLAAVMVVVMLAWAMRRPVLRERIHAVLLRLPVLGAMLRLADTARFSAALAILSGGGVPILPALQASAFTLRMDPLREAVDAAAVAVREGAPLSKALRVSGAFPPLLTHLIASGELTGSIAPGLDAAARASEMELNARTGMAMALIEPALIVAMGLVVLAVVLAVLMPVIDINQLLGKR